MKNKKIFLIAVVPVLIIVLMWLLTQAFELIRQPSDQDVALGFLLLGVTLAIIVFSTLFIKNKFFKS